MCCKIVISSCCVCIAYAVSFHYLPTVTIYSHSKQPGNIFSFHLYILCCSNNINTHLIAYWHMSWHLFIKLFIMQENPENNERVWNNGTFRADSKQMWMVNREFIWSGLRRAINTSFYLLSNLSRGRGSTNRLCLQNGASTQSIHTTTHITHTKKRIYMIFPYWFRNCRQGWVDIHTAM